jgi:hypothetical protein
MFKTLVSAATLAGVLALAGCSDSPAPASAKTDTPKKSDVPTGAITAQTAFDPVYRLARQVAPDIETASITANEVDGVKSEDGKYAKWTFVFVSPSTKKAITFVYTTVEQPALGLLKGANNAGTQPWAGATRDATPFSNSEFSTDSDDAYKAATTKAADWLAKNKDKPITTFALGKSNELPAPMWYIMWGDKKAGGYAVYVNASTGKVFK